MAPAHRTPKKIKPPALLPGDKIGIVAPASPVQRAEFEAGCAALAAMGYQPVYSASIFDRDLFFAGGRERRVREIEEMMARADVRAILCARGGYGSNYLLERLSAAKFRRHPKIFIGYSDLTVLLTFLCDRAGLVAFHGPMLTKGFAQPGGIDAASWQAALGASSCWQVDTSGVRPLAPGRAQGTLYGGCLSLLAASVGTPHEFSSAGTLLFLEDVDTKPYQVDRMLRQLRLAGKFKGVRGIIFGEMLNCTQPGAPYTLQEVIARNLRDLKIPVACGLRSGHVAGANITLPLGVRAELKVEGEVELDILEAATTPRASSAARRRAK